MDVVDMVDVEQRQEQITKKLIRTKVFEGFEGFG